MCYYLFNKLKSLCSEIWNSDLWNYNLYTGERWDDHWE